MLKLGYGRRTTTFGLGMSDNGTGLVLAELTPSYSFGAQPPASRRSRPKDRRDAGPTGQIQWVRVGVRDV